MTDMVIVSDFVRVAGKVTAIRREEIGMNVGLLCVAVIKPFKQ